MTEAQALEKVREAARALSKLEADIRDEKQVANRAIDEARRPELASHRAILAAAKVAHQAAQDAKPPHEWDGKRVFRIEIKYARWSRAIMSETRLEGIVETRRGNTLFASNISDWRLPSMGSGFVRLLKKDGTPALKFEDLRGWELVP